MEDEFDDRMVELTSGRRLVRFAIPSVILILFISTYNMVDGLFVSNYVDTDALAAINILMPVMSVFMSVGFLFSTFMGIDGVWLSMPVTQFLTFAITLYLLYRSSGRYGYRMPFSR